MAGLQQEANAGGLTGAAAAGNVDALSQLYREYADDVYSTAYRLLGNRADAQDVLQDVFVGLPRALRNYRESGQFAAWINRVTVRTSLMHMRSARRRRETDLDDVTDVLSNATDSAVNIIAVRRAIAGLPEILRIAYMLRTVEGHSHDEIASLLGITPGASATRVSRATDLLRKELST
jgi:RNA polymerase sigma-70 factor (ECF subfamily)